MSDSPASATPYEVLGVSPAASQDELRRAYRRLARQTHPDLGGTPERFRRVQLAWELVGSVDDRARYDSGRPAARESQREGHTWAPAPPRRRTESKPRARAFGHPGGQARELYLALLHEWVGRGETVDDPYDTVLVRSAPGEIRRCLAKALAEEATATAIGELGIAYTVWSDVSARAEVKLDHVVLAPTGVYAIRSDDWGGRVSAVKGELVGDGVPPDEQPVRALTRSARAFAKTSRVPFTALLVVVPDDAAGDPVEPIGKGRRNSAYLVRRSVLPHLLREGLDPEAPRVDVFELRDRLQQSVRFV
ncbi:nuclease-like protein [Frondihabitans sp. PhB188]|uniref:J domain-containing protein n=1 Tax=Frondihabitans sp. PhB188 TaxID=2485200 RepID=UPI000F4A59BF|nr:nuclease-related domain-containing protein [Frondihabitans sp. PhB188]ROQ40826.1 nuclease-like protein [Frondihabitans sp. PhB188]